jgi:hypothetical protein
VPEQPPAGLEYKTLALAEVPLRLQVKSVALDEPAGPGTSGATSAPYEYVTEEGVHVGVAESFVAVTGVRDKVGDVIPAGAFKRTLAELEPKACMGHDWNRPIGFPEAIEEWLPGDPRLPETKVDGTPWPEYAGVLWARTRYNLETEDGRRAYADAKFFGPQRTCWSIGYVPSKLHTKHGVDPHTGLPSRFLHDPDLFEYSQVLHGAHPMALGQSIKSGEPDGLESKLRYVQDAAYWGYPVNTPIRPGMRPRGKTAQRIRATGKTPSLTEGVTTEPPEKGTRASAATRQAGADAEGLFPEPESDARVRADKPKGADQQHIADLAMNQVGDLEGEPDDNRDKAFRGLLREGITPNELRADLENVADNEKNTSNAELDPDEIDDLVEEYQARYDSHAKRQARQRAGKPSEDEEGAGSGEQAPEAVGEQPAEGAAEGDVDQREQPEGEVPGEKPEPGAPAPPEGKPGDRGGVAGPEGAHDPEGKPGEEETAPGEEVPAGQAQNPGTVALAAFEEGDETALAEALDELQRNGAEITNADGTPMSSAEDVARELLTDTDTEQARELLDEWSARGAPNVAGGAGTADAASKVGDGPYTAAYEKGIAALDGEDLQGVADALEELRVGNRITLDRNDGSHVRLSQGTASLAAELFNDPNGRDRLAAWATAANESHATEADNDRDFYASQYEQRSDEELETEHQNLTAQQAEQTARGENPYTWPLSEINTQLQALERVREQRASGDAENDAPEIPDPGDVAVITADETDETEQLGDTAHGVTEADDGTFEADDDVATRQDRVAGMLAQSEGGGLDLSDRSDDQLRGDRADVVAELRLQTHLDNRRRKRAGGTPTAPGTGGHTGDGDGTGGTDQPVPGEATGDQPDGPPAPEAPPTRPGVAGAAEDLADALESGDEDAINRTRARLAATLRRSRSNAESVQALRALMDSPGDVAPEQLRAAAEAIRAEIRARRNTNARNRRAVRRFERERLRSLLGQIEAEMGNRGLDFDTVPEDLGGDTVEGDLPGAATGPPAGTWVSGSEREEWSGVETRTLSVTGSHYSALVTTGGTGGRTRWEWAVVGGEDNGQVLASGSGESTDPGAAQAAVEIALDTQAKLGNLPADAQLPTGSIPTDTSATPAEEVAAALDAVRERLTRPGRPVNPITGRPDPLTGTVVNTRAPTRRAFESATDVRLHLEARALLDASTGLPARLAKVRWDSAVLTPGGQFMVINYADRTAPELVSTTHLLQANPRVGSLIGATDNMGKADLLRLGALLESMRDTGGNSVDWTQPAGEPLREQIERMDFGDGRTGYDGVFTTALTALALDKLRAGKWNDKLLQRLAGSEGGTTGVTNWSRHNRIKGFNATLTSTLSSLGYGQKRIDPADKATLQIAGGAQALYALGAPDAAAVLLRRRATELRSEFGDGDAATRGAPLLEAMATSMLGAYSPVRSPGDRLYSIRAGERLALATIGDSREVPTFRALSAMRRAGGQYAQPTALFVDEGSGKTYTGTIVTESGRDRLHLSDAERPGYPVWRGELGSNMAVLGADEPVPTTREELAERADADANAFDTGVLDAAAETLPESAAERDKRKGSTPEGEPPPRRTSPRAPRRTAPPPPDTAPVPGQEHLAEAQARNQRGLLGLEFQLDDRPRRDGFESLEQVRAYLTEKLADVPADRKRKPGMGDPLTPEYMQQRIIDDPDYSEAGGAKLSPGGHFIVTKRGLVIHARTGGAVWGMGVHMEDFNDPTPDSAMAVADHLERGRFDGKGSVNWRLGTAEAMQEHVKYLLADAKFGATGLPSRVVPTIALPASRAALLDLAARAKTPKAADIATLRSIARHVPMREAPNPEAFNVMAVRLNANRYHALSGKRVQGADYLPANSNAGARVAKRVAAELTIGESLGAASPLDAVRRLRRVADEIGDEPVTDTDGKSFTPAADLRALAQSITDAWDTSKPSPMGRLLRNNETGTISLTRDIEVEGSDPRNFSEPMLEAMEAEAERLTEDLKRYPLILDKTDDGHRRARFGPHEIVADGYAEKIELRSDGAIEITQTTRVGRMRIYLPAGSWEHDPDTEQAPPGGVDAPSGPSAEEERKTLDDLIKLRSEAAAALVAAVGVAPQKRRKVGQGRYAAQVGKYVGEMEAAAQAGQWRIARSRLTTLGSFFRSDLPASFDPHAALALAKDFEHRDGLLVTAAPFPPPVGGSAVRRGQVIDILLRLSREAMPGAGRQLTSVEMGATGNRRALAHYSYFEGSAQMAKMTIGAGTFDDGQKVGLENGWFTKSGEDITEHVISHEYGHHLHHVLRRETPERNAAMLGEIAAELGVVSDPADPTAWVTKNKAAIIAKLGTYAATNDRELIAELFAEWWGKRDGASPAARIVGRYLGRPEADSAAPSGDRAEGPPRGGPRVPGGGAETDAGAETSPAGTPEPPPPGDTQSGEVTEDDDQADERRGPGEPAGVGAGGAGQSGQG